MSINKKTIRLRICRLMDAGRTEEASMWMDGICTDDQYTVQNDDPRKRKVWVTDRHGVTTEYPSIDACAEAFCRSTSTIKRGIAQGTPTTGVIKGYTFVAEPPNRNFWIIKVKATEPNGKVTIYDSIQDVIRRLNISGATLHKSLNGEAITKGQFSGWDFKRCE